jgi:hypothetical protein
MMKGRGGPIATMIVGLLIMVAGVVVLFAVLPSQAQFPDDVDSTRTYDGTLEILLNPQALAEMDVANLFYENVPVTIDRHVTTEDTDGGTALVLENARIKAPTGDVLVESNDYYVIDRTSMEHTTGFADDGRIRPERQGLVIGFPIGTEERDYQGWSDDYMALETLSYQGAEDVEGLTVYRFVSGSEPRPIADPAMFGLPPGLPKGTVEALAPMLLDPDGMAQMAALLPVLPDPVPFGYLYAYQSDYWIEPDTGMLVDYTKSESRILGIPTDAVPGGFAPIGEIFSLTYEQSAASVDDAVSEAEDYRNLLNLFGTVIPASALGVGALVMLVGLVFFMRRKPSETPAADDTT